MTTPANKEIRNKRITKAGYAISQVDSTPLYYQLSGTPGEANDGALRLPIVLCDGIGCDGFIWKYLLPQFQSDRKVLHWHYRGHGRSPTPKDPNAVSIPDFCDDLASVMDDAGIQKAIIVGHSMGVQVALEFYRKHQSRVAALLLICGTHSEPLQTFKGSNFLETILPYAQKTVSRTPKILRTLGQHLLAKDWVYKLATKFEIQEEYLSRQDFMPYLEGLSHMDPAVFLSILAQSAVHSAKDLLPNILIPTLIIAGELDTFTPPTLSQEMSDLIPNSKLYVVKDGTHTAILEHHRLVGTVISDFFTLFNTQVSSL